MGRRYRQRKRGASQWACGLQGVRMGQFPAIVAIKPMLSPEQELSPYVCDIRRQEKLTPKKEKGYETATQQLIKAMRNGG